MLKVDLSSQKFVGLTPLFLAQGGFKERQDLQRWIRNSSDAFFDYIGEPLLILGEEVAPSDTVMDRIDLLAVDSDGEVVIIELKRGSNKWQLSQALSYAAMISKWGQGDSFLTNMKTISNDVLKDFLDTDTSEVNSVQRVILIAEAYDFEVLITAEWLTENYGLDIRCYQISLGQDMSHNAVYVSCARLYPPGDLADLAVSRKTKPTRALASRSWAERLDRCENRDIKQFFEEQLRLETRKTGNDSALAYPATGTVHWNVEIRSKRALVVQVGRFQTAGGEDDESFWQKHLTTADVSKLRNGANLRFFLVTPEDVQVLNDIVQSMPELTWLKTSPVLEEP